MMCTTLARVATILALLAAGVTATSCYSISTRSTCRKKGLVEGTGAFETCYALEGYTAEELKNPTIRAQWLARKKARAKAMAEMNAKLEADRKRREKHQREFWNKTHQIRSDFEGKVARESGKAQQAERQQRQAERQREAAARAEQRKRDRAAALAKWREQRRFEVCNGYRKGMAITVTAAGYFTLVNGRKTWVPGKVLKLAANSCQTLFKPSPSRVYLKASCLDGATWRGGKSVRQQGGILRGVFSVRAIKGRPSRFTFNKAQSSFRAPPVEYSLRVCNNLSRGASLSVAWPATDGKHRARGAFWLKPGACKVTASVIRAKWAYIYARIFVSRNTLTTIAGPYYFCSDKLKSPMLGPAKDYSASPQDRSCAKKLGFYKVDFTKPGQHTETLTTNHPGYRHRSK